MFSFRQMFARSLRSSSTRNPAFRVSRKLTPVHALTLEHLEARDLWATTYLWIAQGQNLNWSNPNNWQNTATNNVATVAPVPGDSLLFTNVSRLNSTDDIQALSLASLTIASTYSFPIAQPGQNQQAQPQITLSQDLIIGGGSMATLNPLPSDATITGTKNLIIANRAAPAGLAIFDWTSGTMGGTGQLIVAPGAVLNITSTKTNKQIAELSGRGLTVAGPLQVPLFGAVGVGGNVNFTSGNLLCTPDPTSQQVPVINNYGAFNIGQTATGINGQAIFTNKSSGNIIITAIPEPKISFTLFPGITFNNICDPATGSISITSALNVEGGGTSSGPWSVAGQVQFKSATYTWNQGTQFTSTGNVHIGKAGTVQIPGGTTVSSEPSVGIIGGTLSGGGQLSITTKCAFTDGSISGGVTVTVMPTASMAIYSRVTRAFGEGTSPTLNGSTIQVNGTLYLGNPPATAYAAGGPTTLTMGGTNATIAAGANGIIQITDTSGIQGLSVTQNGMTTTTLGVINLTAGSLTKLKNSGQSNLQLNGIIGQNGANATAQPGSSIKLFQNANTPGFLIQPPAAAGPAPGSPPAPPPDTPDGEEDLTFSNTFSVDTIADIDSDGELSGWGEADGPLVENDGTVQPGTSDDVGQLTFGANYTQTAHIPR